MLMQTGKLRYVLRPGNRFSRVARLIVLVAAEVANETGQPGVT